MRRNKLEKPELTTGVMAGAEVKAYRRYIGSNMGSFGDMLGGITSRTIGKYEKGDMAVPTAVADSIRSLLYPRRGQPEAVTPQSEPKKPSAAARAKEVAKGLVQTKPPARRKKNNTAAKSGRKLLYTIEIYEMGD